MRALQRKLGVSQTSIWRALEKMRHSKSDLDVKHCRRTEVARISVHTEHSQMLLTRDEERQLVEWLHEQNEKSMPPSRKELYFRMKELLQSRDPPRKLDKQPTSTWFKAFERRHGLSLRQSRPIETARVKANTTEVPHTIRIPNNH